MELTPSNPYSLGLVQGHHHTILYQQRPHHQARVVNRSMSRGIPVISRRTTLKTSGLIVLAIGAALAVMAIRGSWTKVLPFLAPSKTGSGGCPPGFLPQSMVVVSGITGTNYC